METEKMLRVTQHLFDNRDSKQKELEAVMRATSLPEEIIPGYYQYELNGAIIDVFDIARAMKLPNTLFNALKYFRIKGDKDKQINDLEKAIECIKREIDYLRQ